MPNIKVGFCASITIEGTNYKNDIKHEFTVDSSGASFTSPVGVVRAASSVENSVIKNLNLFICSILTIVIELLCHLSIIHDKKRHEMRTIMVRCRFGTLHVPLLDTDQISWPVRKTAYTESMESEVLNAATYESTRKVTESINRANNLSGSQRMRERSVARNILQAGHAALETMREAVSSELGKLGTIITESRYTTVPREVAEAQGWIYVPEESEDLHEANSKIASDTAVKLNKNMRNTLITKLRKRFGDSFDIEKAEEAFRKRSIDVAKAITAIEHPGEKVLYLMIDGVLSHLQKKDHDRSISKRKKWTENMCCYIEVDGYRAVLVAPNLKELMDIVLAFLSANGLLADRRLVVLADGDTNIWTALDEVFYFRQCDKILDWYHLSHKVYEKTSSGLYGDKKTKGSIRSHIKTLLWNGRVDSAIEYLDGLKDKQIRSHNGTRHAAVRNSTAINELIDYLKRKKDYIPCYALRKEMGLLVSSNCVEQTNNLLVSERQKNNGMAWSEEGSIALAVITMFKRNGILDNYIKTGRFNLQFPLIEVGGERASALRAHRSAPSGCDQAA